MEKLQVFLTNQVVISAVTAWLIAQGIKVIHTLIKERRFNFERIMGSGGMPSSHSATVLSASIAIAETLGYDSPIFGLSLVFSFIVMYDACGIRRAAGKQAAILNSMVEALRLHQKINYQKKLKELLGHTYLEVLVGAMLGIIIGLVIAM